MKLFKAAYFGSGFCFIKMAEGEIVMSDKEKITIGAKTLDDIQMENVLPGYNNIFSQIERMREYAESCNDEGKSVNNVFSIFGKRGAGKSSVLLTIQSKIKQNNESDIVLPVILPIILPENMRNRGDMMGWILGTFKNIVEKFSREEAETVNKGKIDDKNFMNCRKAKMDTSVYKKYKKVLEQYRYTRVDYADILKDNYSGFKDYLEETQNILDPENGLRESFFDFIKELVSTKIKLEKIEENKVQKNPMIFIFLDDIDLTKKHCIEILQLISRYLCHPNIVTFISGDYDIFETEQFMGYMRESGLMQLVVAPDKENSIGQRLLRENKLLAADALKKIMPPSYRYKMRTLSPVERLDFYYDKGENKKLKDILQQKFKSLMKSKESLKVINAYGLIFDEMPRGIINVYYTLSNLEDNKVLKESPDSENYKKYISQFRMFFDTIIRSSSILSKYEEEIKRCIQINDVFTETFFNHQRLMKELDKSEDRGRKTGARDMKDTYDLQETNNELLYEKVVVLVFAHFIESIVQLANSNRKIHGQSQIREVLEEKELAKIKIYPKINQSDVVFNLYESMLSNDAQNIMPTMDNIYLKDFSVKFYFEKLEEIDAFKEGKKAETFGDIMNQDADWAKQNFEIIYYHRDAVCLMFNKAIDKWMNFVQEKEKIEENIKKYFNRDRYDDITKENTEKQISDRVNGFQDKIKEMINTLKEELDGKSNFSKDDDFKKVKEKINEYFAKQRIKNCEDTDEQKTRILYLAITLTVYEEMDKFTDYEYDYFSYFEKWHNELLKSDVYKTWIEEQKNKSPLTLVLGE